MTELLSEKEMMNQKRGGFLKALAILSWISMGIMLFFTLFSALGGPLSDEELERQKIVALEAITPEMIQVFGKELVEENIMILEVTQEKFYSITGLKLANLVLGVYAVFLMFTLKKKGYYFYLVYSMVPIVSTVFFFGTGTLMTFWIAMIVIFSLLFSILYAAQLKRMS